MHRRACVEHDRRRHIRRVAELFGVDAICPRDELPVDVLEIVARPIVAILAEFRAISVERAAVQPRHESIDDDARDELEITDVRENRRQP